MGYPHSPPKENVDFWDSLYMYVSHWQSAEYLAIK